MRQGAPRAWEQLCARVARSDFSGRPLSLTVRRRMRPVLVHVRALPLDARKMRVTYATPVGEGLLRLLGPIPFGEKWEFSPSEYVEYEDQLLSDGTHGLVIARSASRDPEFWRRRRLYAILGLPVGAFVAIFWTAKLGLLYPAAYLVSATLGAVTFSALSARWRDRAWYGALRPIARWWWV